MPQRTRAIRRSSHNAGPWDDEPPHRYTTHRHLQRSDEPGDASPTTFEIVDSLGGAVPGTVTYDPITAKATFVPDTGLIYANTYTARVRSGAGGVKDMSGRSLAADVTWTFGIEAVPPPVAVLTDPGNPFTTYLQEILRAEGVTFATSRPPPSRRRCCLL